MSSRSTTDALLLALHVAVAFCPLSVRASPACDSGSGLPCSFHGCEFRLSDADTLVRTGNCSHPGSGVDLQLQNKSIAALQADVFANLPSVRTLRLHDNQISHVNASVFLGMPHLRTLFFGRNVLSHFAAKPVGNLPHLTTLSLDNNQITNIGADDLVDLPGLTRLHLDSNWITFIDADAFLDQKNLAVLSIGNNSLLCRPLGLYDPLVSIVLLTDTHMCGGLVCSECPADGSFQQIDADANGCITLSEWTAEMCGGDCSGHPDFSVLATSNDASCISESEFSFGMGPPPYEALDVSGDGCVNVTEWTMVVCNGDCEHLDGIPAFADIATLLDDVSCITDDEYRLQRGLPRTRWILGEESSNASTCDMVCAELNEGCIQTELDALEQDGLNGGNLVLDAFLEAGATCQNTDTSCQNSGSDGYYYGYYGYESEEEEEEESEAEIEGEEHYGYESEADEEAAESTPLSCAELGNPYMAGMTCHIGRTYATCNQITTNNNTKRLCPCSYTAWRSSSTTAATSTSSSTSSAPTTSTTAMSTSSSSTPSPTSTSSSKTSAGSSATASTPPPVGNRLSCTAGSYENSGQCAPCPSSMTSPDGSTSISNCSCIGGYSLGNRGSCKACDPGTYSINSNTSALACQPCPSQSQSDSAAKICNCVEGYVRKKDANIDQGCLVRVRPPPSGNMRLFLMIISLQVRMNSTDTGELKKGLAVQTAGFFSVDVSVVSVDVASAKQRFSSLATRRREYGANLEVELLDDPAAVTSRLTETRGLLEEFLKLDLFSDVKVLDIKVTCGSGYSPMPGSKSSSSNVSAQDSINSSSCLACSVGFYKQDLDNSPCQACPRFSTTGVPAASNLSQCVCNTGYMPGNSTDLECVSSMQYLSVEDAEIAARTVSSAVGAVVATNVAIAVSTAVVSSVSSAVAASSGGAVGGAVGAGMGGGGGAVMAEGGSAGSSGGGSTLTLITQVQFLNQVGRIGGSEGSESLATFSDGFSWANWDLGLSLAQNSTPGEGTNTTRRHRGRRAPKAKSKTGSQLAEQNQQLNADGTCTFENISPPLERIVTCIIVLVGVFCARNLVILAITKFIHHKKPLSLVFPAWEGPVVLVQYMCLCDSAMASASLLCPAGIAFGVLVILMGPLAFVVISMRIIARHYRQGDMKFEWNSPPRFAELKRRVSKASGIVAKVVVAHAWYSNAMVRGGWIETESSAHWGFLTNDFCGSFWAYSIWVLVKKLWLTCVLNMFDGIANAALALVVQFVDTILLLYLRPYVDWKSDLTEALGGITNLLSFLVISIPVFAGPGIAIPFLGDFTSVMLAVTATGISAIVGLASPIVLLLETLLKVVAFVAVKTGVSGVGEVDPTVAAANADVMHNLADEFRGQLEESYRIHGSEGAVLAGGMVAGASISDEQTQPVVQEEVCLVLTLAMSMQDIAGEEEEFKAGVARDVAAAVDGDPDMVRVLALEEGSIRVHMAIDEGICRDRAALDVANEIREQAADPFGTSRLKERVYTQFALGAHVSIIKVFKVVACRQAAPDAVMMEPMRPVSADRNWDKAMQDQNPVPPFTSPGDLGLVWDSESHIQVQRRSEWLSFTGENPILSVDPRRSGGSTAVIGTSPVLHSRFPTANTTVSPDASARASIGFKIELSQPEHKQVSQMSPGVFLFSQETRQKARSLPQGMSQGVSPPPRIAEGQPSASTSAHGAGARFGEGRFLEAREEG